MNITDGETIFVERDGKWYTKDGQPCEVTSFEELFSEVSETSRKDPLMTHKSKKPYIKPDAMEFEINSIKDWPQSSNGAWVIRMIRKFLEKKMYPDPDAFFDCPFDILCGLNAVQYVQWAVKVGNAESHTDAWHDVFGLARRIYE